MRWDVIEAIGTTAAALVAVFALRWQITSFKSSLAADLAMKLDDRFSLAEFRAIRAKAALALRNHVTEEDAEDVFDFFETVGLFTRRRILDVEIVHSFFFHWINVYWIAGRDHISKKQRGTHSAWKEFGDLYLKVLKIEKEQDPESEDISPSPEKITSYLNDEIALSTDGGVR